MNFTSVRIIPSHGTRSAIVTWAVPDGYEDGTVDIAFSLTAAPDSWELRTDEPVAASDGQFTDTNFVVQAGVPIGYYRLRWTRGEESFLSQPLGIMGDVTRREYGIMNAILLREFQVMRATDGFPVFHLIQRDNGAPSSNADPDTGLSRGTPCADDADSGYTKSFKGGFYPPLLTWVKPLAAQRGGQEDSADGAGSTEAVGMKLTMLAFPQPQRDHILVDPVTDRRYEISAVEAHAIRANFPAVYTVTAAFLPTSHPAYRIAVPRDQTQWRNVKPHFMP